jgi:ankyrin repeat protein
VEVVRRLLAARADVEKEDTKKRWKPICFAAAAGNAQVMKALLEVQADVNDSEPFQLSQADDFAAGLTHTHMNAQWVDYICLLNNLMQIYTSKK